MVNPFRSGLAAGLAALVVLALSACSFVPPAVETYHDPAGHPKVLFFKATPSRIESGDPVRLQWEVTSADSVVIEGIGPVPLRGSVDVRPDKLTAYNLTAESEAGCVASAVFVNVRPFVRVTSQVTGPSDAGSIPSGALPRLAANQSYVFFNGAVMVGADDHFIVLRNNPSSHNPTWDELTAFLKTDQTDKREYVPGKFTCGDFAEALHNNAETAGIRSAIVAIELVQDPMGQNIVNHSLNAFQTTDRGIMYIDDTSSTQHFYADKEAHVVVGDDYLCVSLWPTAGQLQKWPSMGKIRAVDIFQW